MQPEQVFEPERREFVRIKRRLEVKYKFISQTDRPQDDRVWEGFTKNIGGGGILLVGGLPDKDLIMDLLTHRVVMGVNIDLPSTEHMIKALTRVAWIEVPEQVPDKCLFGLAFREIAKEHMDEILKFIIKAQMG